MTRITFSEAAGQDLEDIYEYIADDSVVAADRFRERLKHRWEKLREQPRMGRARSDIRPGY